MIYKKFYTSKNVDTYRSFYRYKEL